MKTRRTLLALAPLALASLLAPLSGCLSVGDAPVVRYWRPAPVVWPLLSTQSPTPVRLSTESSPVVDTTMTWRLSNVEVAFDGQNRWADKPARVVEEALREALFARGPFVGSERGSVARLDVRVTKFEGERGSAPFAELRLEATWTEPDRDSASRPAAFDARVRLTRADASSLATGMGGAIEEAVSDLRDWLVARTR